MPEPRANPMGGNPFATRADAQQAVRDLVDPIIPHMSPGGARVRLGSGAALFPQRVAELEGYARPLYGIVPLVAGGGHFAHWDRWCDGLAAGTDPENPEYWGPCAGDTDQRMVEMAAIGFAMAFTPEHIWEPLGEGSKERVLAWLDGIDEFEPGANNWQFFRLLVHLGRQRVGTPGDPAAAQRSIERIEEYHVEDGWYQDGRLGTVDWYLPFAFHTYGLILAASGLGDREAAARYVERAGAFGPEFRHWFGPDGAAIPYGRSMTYRFAQSSLWGAFALADIEGVPWDEARGHWARHQRWWADRPISDRDGVLSIGYGYDNRRLAEGYNSPGSPYWAMKAFTALAAPDDHPFWTGEEAGHPLVDLPVVQPVAGWVLDRDDTHAVALSGRRSPPVRFLEQTTAKYEKFAYSSRYGFSGEVEFHYGDALTDSTLLLRDGTERRTRSSVEDAFIEHGPDGPLLWSRWRPWPDVVVDTVLAGGAPWHHRLHLVRTGRGLMAIETGFALAVDSMRISEGPLAPEVRSEDGLAVVRTATDLSGMVDGDGGRSGEVRPLPPNAGMVYPQGAVPVLRCLLQPGEHILACSVVAASGVDGINVDLAPTVPRSAYDLLEREHGRVTEPNEPLDVEAVMRLRFAGQDE